uniref:Uncharacterized protein n=1 Tax=Arundo donax TaxID=35708 RepID=A0A0A9DAW6_ARUDO
MHQTAHRAALNIPVPRATPSFSACATVSLTRSSFTESSLENSAISEAVRPHCCRNAMLGLTTYSRFKLRR